MTGPDQHDHHFGNPYAPPVAPVHEPLPMDGEQELASRGQRVLAFLIDCAPAFVGGVVGAVIGFAAARRQSWSPSDLSGGTIFLIAVLGMAALAWTIVSFIFLYQFGQTIGKRAIGIRVVRMDGSRISFPRIFFMRGLLAALPGAIPYIGWIYRIADYAFVLGEPRRCIHDYIADSKVVTAASSENATLAGSR